MVRAADEIRLVNPGRRREREPASVALREGYHAAHPEGQEKRPTSPTACRAREAAATLAARDTGARRWSGVDGPWPRAAWVPDVFARSSTWPGNSGYPAACSG